MSPEPGLIVQAIAYFIKTFADAKAEQIKNSKSDSKRDSSPNITQFSLFGHNFTNSSSQVDSRKQSIRNQLKDPSVVQEIASGLKDIREELASDDIEKFYIESETKKQSIKKAKHMGIGFSKQELDFVVEKLPREDLALWLTASSLMTDLSTEQVDLVKDQLRLSGGEKGRNIGNLCSKGYLSDEIIPRYQELDSSNNLDAFNEYYKTLVVDLAKSVFVGMLSKPDDILTELKSKLSEAKKNGYTEVRLHALGSHNSKTLRQAVAKFELECEGYSVESETSPAKSQNYSIKII